jgi:hypothetical protein
MPPVLTLSVAFDGRVWPPSRCARGPVWARQSATATAAKTNAARQLRVAASAQRCDRLERADHFPNCWRTSVLDGH